MSKSIFKIKVAFLMGSLFFSCTQKEVRYVKLSDDKTSYYLEDLKQLYFKSLDSTTYYLSQIDTLKSLSENEKAFLNARKWYKKAEPYIVAFDYENHKTLNGPNLLKVEEEAPNDIKKIKPKSLQVVEELLLGEEKDNKTLHKTLVFLNARVPFMKKNHMLYKQTDRHFLKMIRDQIVLIATKGITGFDSPVLSNSLKESAYAYETILEVFIIYKNSFNDTKLFEQWKNELQKTIDLLKNSDFEKFDRYEFIKNDTNKQLSLINQTAKDWEISLKDWYHLNPKSNNLFAQDFFNLKAFRSEGIFSANDSIIALGKRIFNDKKLSKDNLMSCATCHMANKAFSDGLVTAASNAGKPLLRNTPTLTYVAYQKAFFYDGIALSLEGQIKNVVENTQEFHTDLFTIENEIKNDSSYVVVFNELYNNGVTNQNIINAIANYERSLGDFSSKFDKNMRGELNNLTVSEQNGFNLFMGKAACATCHFPPVFNGTVPPKFDESELELIGVPETKDTINPIISNDFGRYNLYKTEERKYFFKTPTIRNSNETGPYMHNGVYNTLEEIVEFYNKGGGAGLGIDIPNQTLPPTSLGLTKQEIKDIVNFMKTLSDENY